MISRRCSTIRTCSRAACGSRSTTPCEPDLSLIRNAITFSGTPVKDYRAPPLLGADTKDVLATIGYDDAKVEALKAQKIV